MSKQLEIISKNEVTILDKIDREKVKSQIYEVRGLRVMLDSDIAAYFGVETGALNRAMKRNIKRFPPEFCFQLTTEECSRCQIGILNIKRGQNNKQKWGRIFSMRLLIFDLFLKQHRSKLMQGAAPCEPLVAGAG